MKIIFDATAIANTIYKDSLNPKTGVFRVAQQILANLEGNKCDIGLTSLFISLPRLASFLKENDFKCVNSKESLVISKFMSYVFSLIPRRSLTEKNILYALRKSGLLSIKHGLFNTKELKQYDLYHSPFHAIPNSVLKRHSIKQLITVHDLIPKILPEYKGLSIELEINKILDSIDEETFVSCVSESAKQDLLNHHSKVDPARVSVIPLAADANIFYRETDQDRIKTILKKYQIDDEKPYFLLLSTLELRKNLKSSIGAFAKLIEQENLKELQLVLVGSEGRKIGELFKSLNVSKSLRKRIIATGFVEDEDLSAIYSGALAFIYPSIYEGFGLPPLEAMQCGIPVITSNNSSLPEVVGQAGLLVNAEDEDAIAEHMLKLYHNADLRTELANKSLLQAQKFSWQNFNTDYWNLYTRILNS
ncbi:glycosyltransferase family 4 protein [Pedobacter sandarakinus]|uniref:glycosyltransferase family 4 protein n=1 Tax=Pedobacter sandarakinus TaxID=353156 RepID=UPI002246CBB0|nr:glycosyltransferase family 1 protein [Pedobacter sandarakinus]MCX2574031.1 glycosyltransferase family 1 protein [Pedobacter sandarakinus]